MKVTSATFVGAASEPGRFPAPSHPEVAFAGRSNVGKSSAINRLVGRRGLARTSSTPGRTQQLNFFDINDRLVLVDLPGYGYAKVSHAARDAWRPLVESYLGTRGVLAGVILIVDVRRGLEEEEDQLLEFLAALAIPALVIATKIDKLNRGAQAKALRALATGAVPIVPFSAVTGEGVAAVWKAIAEWTRAETRGRRRRGRQP
ncbi:MAG: GTP-binding protein [Deltaproteobacteria bacterium]|nr:GTP-binding protein [Deltaproteobacteria bacterium]